MEDISGFGTRVRLVADTTFPAGVDITQFADDADALDSAAVQIGDQAMGLNGDLVGWTMAAIIPLTINVIPGSADDNNLAILWQRNRAVKGGNPARDTISLVVSYPNGKQAVFSGGKIRSGIPGLPIASAGRMKSKAYEFAFENLVIN